MKFSIKHTNTKESITDKNCKLVVHAKGLKVYANKGDNNTATIRKNHASTSKRVSKRNHIPL